MAVQTVLEVTWEHIVTWHHLWTYDTWPRFVGLCNRHLITTLSCRRSDRLVVLSSTAPQWHHVTQKLDSCWLITLFSHVTQKYTDSCFLSRDLACTARIQLLDRHWAGVTNQGKVSHVIDTNPFQSNHVTWLNYMPRTSDHVTRVYLILVLSHTPSWKATQRRWLSLIVSPVTWHSQLVHWSHCWLVWRSQSHAFSVKWRFSHISKMSTEKMSTEKTKIMVPSESAEKEEQNGILNNVFWFSFEASELEIEVVPWTCYTRGWDKTALETPSGTWSK